MAACVGQRGDLVGEAGHLAGDDPELVLGQNVIFLLRIGILVVPCIQRIHQVVQSSGTVLAQGFQLHRSGVLGALQQVDLVIDLGQLLAQGGLRCIAVDLSTAVPAETRSPSATRYPSVPPPAT